MTLPHYSTGEVVKKSGVPRMTLLRWVKRGLLPPLKTLKLVGAGTVYLWEDKHVRAAAKLKGKLKPGPKPRKK